MHQIMKFSSRGYSSLVESFTAVRVFRSKIRYYFVSILERQLQRVRSILQLWVVGLAICDSRGPSLIHTLTMRSVMLLVEIHRLVRSSRRAKYMRR
jgi:hypothetical protein